MIDALVTCTLKILFVLSHPQPLPGVDAVEIYNLTLTLLPDGSCIEGTVELLASSNIVVV